MKLGSLDAIASALAAENVRYLIVGGLAVAAHGFGRVTFDIDLVVQLQPDNIKRAMTALESLGYRPTVPEAAERFADARLRERWMREKGMVVFQMHSDIHPETQIDLFVSEPFEFDSEYDAALVGELQPGLEVRFVRIETLIRGDAAWAAHNLSQLRYFQSLRLREKLEAVEGMADIVRRFREMRRKGHLKAR